MGVVNYTELVGKVIKHYGSQKSWNQITSVCRLVAADKDRVKVEFDVSKNMTNSWETMHGGCTASLIDMLTTIAVLSHETNTHPGVSVSLNVSYCNAARTGDTLILDAFVEKRGRSLVFTRANMYRKLDNKIIAFAEHVKAFTPPPSK